MRPPESVRRRSRTSRGLTYRSVSSARKRVPEPGRVSGFSCLGCQDVTTSGPSSGRSVRTFSGWWLAGLFAVDELGMVERVTSWGVAAGRHSTIERVDFLDPVVNGILLRNQLRIDGMDAGCTPLRSGWPLREGLAWLDQLADPSGAGRATGRVAILCQVCGDVDCGLLSATVERSAGVVRWSRWFCRLSSFRTEAGGVGRGHRVMTPSWAGWPPWNT